MFGRGHKTPAENPNQPTATSVYTIPDVFYGGNDPEAVQGGGGGKARSVQSKNFSEAPVSSGHNKLIATIMIVIFLAACAGAAWYYWNYLRFDFITKTPVNNTPPASPVITSVPEQSTSAAPVITTNTESVVIPTSTNELTSLGDLALEFPTINQIDTTDFDADGLTDAEEEIFGTDPSIFDTDKDEYYDGQEVANLYNPKGLAPVRIIDSGLVREYVAPNDAYRLYYPVSWTIGTVDPAGNTVLITAANGDYLEVRQFIKSSGEDFSTWFGRMAPNERITDLENGLNRFGVSYLRRKDDLTAYVDSPSGVLAIIYHPESSAPINFRHIMRMMLESLRIKGVVAPLVQPTQVQVTPSAPVSTSST